MPPQKSKKIKLTILKRHKKNPIISPKPDNHWEAWQTFNPGAVLLNGKVHLLYRAIGSDGISRLGYAVSKNGLTIENKLSNPAYQLKMKERAFNIYSFFSGGSWGGAEDPRLVRVGKENVLYMMYNACDNGLRVALTSIKLDDFLNKKWKWRQPIFISPPGQAHKNWLLFPEKINGKYAILHSIKPHIQIEYLDDLEFKDNPHIKSIHGGAPRKGVWDKWLRGVGAPPIKTKYGWLIFYHAMDDDWSKYKVGTMLLDLKDPTKVLYRSKKPILEPEEFYENNGFKGGVVYASGAVVKNGKLFIYYGSADSHVCVATANLNEFLKALKKDVEPKVKVKKLNKK
jgi:predicted GH43/DUF377 family glycosyl hydrolase